MAYAQKPLTGSLFKNERMREGRKDPEYTGSIVGPDGEEYWLDAWVKNNKKAENYDPQKKTFFSLSLRPKESRPQENVPHGTSGKQHDLSKPRHMPPPPLHQPAKPEPKLDPQNADGEYTWDAQEK